MSLLQKPWLTTVLATLAAVILASLLLGPIGFAVGCAASLFVIAWRFDNALGTFLPLAVLFLIACGVLGLLLYLMRIVHPG